MRNGVAIITTRDCRGIEIPSGEPRVLPQGTEVFLMQSLGGSYSLQTELGYMVRIDGKDADVIGEVPPLQSPKDVQEVASPADLEKQVWDQLKTCFDPEIPVNIVDLGLVYSCDLHTLPDGKCRVEIKMTLTAPGCGMGHVLKADAESKLMGVPGVKETDIEIVFDPQWDQSRMSEAAKLQLNLM